MECSLLRVDQSRPEGRAETFRAGRERLITVLGKETRNRHGLAMADHLIPCGQIRKCRGICRNGCPSIKICRLGNRIACCARNLALTG